MTYCKYYMYIVKETNDLVSCNKITKFKKNCTCLQKENMFWFGDVPTVTVEDNQTFSVNYLT